MVFCLSKSILIVVLLLTASTLLALPAAAETYPALTVNTDPSGATCTFNGLSASQTTPFTIDLVAGSYDTV